MKKLSLAIVGLSAMFLMSCGGGEKPVKSGKKPVSMLKKAKTEEKKEIKEVVKKVEEALPASTEHADGLKVFTENCKACHQANGQGIASVFPPLAKSDFLADKEATIKQVLNGASGEMVVNGVTFNGTMQSFSNLSDKEIADVLNFVYNSWGNTPEEITTAEVAGLRK